MLFVVRTVLDFNIFISEVKLSFRNAIANNATFGKKLICLLESIIIDVRYVVRMVYALRTIYAKRRA